MTTTELRFHVVTLLAGVYLLAWWSVRGPAEPAPDAPALARTVTAPAPAPPIVVPAGWRLAGSRPAEITPAVQPVVRPAPRPHRIRTRSS